METHQYICSYCSYFIETQGPWPHYNSIDKIQGLMAIVFCPTCDKTKKYGIVKYGRPLSSLADIWLTDIHRKTKIVCHKCRKPVYFVIPSGSVKCPRCKKGAFEEWGHSEEKPIAKSPVPPPQSPLRVRQRGNTIRIPKPMVVIDSQEHKGYKFGRFTNWFAGTVYKRLPVGDYTLIGMEEEHKNFRTDSKVAIQHQYHQYGRHPLKNAKGPWTEK